MQTRVMVLGKDQFGLESAQEYMMLKTLGAIENKIK